MYPIKGGRRVKAEQVSFEPTSVKDHKITIACNQDKKQRFIELCIRQGLVMSHIGDKVVDWLLEVEADLEEGESLVEYLYHHKHIAQELKDKLKAEKRANQVKDEKIARLEKENQELKAGKAKEEQARIARENTHADLHLSADIKAALQYYIADRLQRGKNATVEGVVAHLLCEATASGSSYIAKEFKLKGCFRKLIREKKNN